IGDTKVPMSPELERRCSRHRATLHRAAWPGRADVLAAIVFRDATGEVVAQELLPDDATDEDIAAVKKLLAMRLLTKEIAARGYATRGWPVLPLHSVRGGHCTCGKPDCASPGKHPFGLLVAHGLKDCSTDEAVIRHWWTQQRDATLGIVTGATSGTFVLDVDPRHGGDERLAELEREHGPLPRTTEAATGGGGRHLFFAYPGMRIPSRPIAPGLDVRGDGGYVVAPPSETTGPYAWTVRPDKVEPAAAPEWLLDLVLEPPRSAPHAAPAEHQDPIP